MSEVKGSVTIGNKTVYRQIYYPKFLKVGSTSDFTCYLATPQAINPLIVVTFPESLDVELISCSNFLHLEDGTTANFDPPFQTDSHKHGFNFIAMDGSGAFSFDITLTQNVHYGSYPITVDWYLGSTRVFNELIYITLEPDDISIPYFHSIRLNNYELDRLGNSKTYKVSSLYNLTILDQNESYDKESDSYEYNYRIGVFNTYLPQGYTDEYLIENAVWSDSVSSAGVTEELTVDFNYSEDYPVIILITGEYIETAVYDSASIAKINYTFPCIKEVIEEDYYAEEPGLFYEYSTQDLINNIGSNKLVPSYTNMNPVRCYNMELSEEIGNADNLVVQGVSCIFDVCVTSSCSIILNLLHNTAEGSRSVTLSPGNDTITVGDSFDLWGLDYNELTLANLEDVELEIIASNPYDTECDLTISNVKLTYHYIQPPEPIIQSWVNGIDLGYFNVFIQNVHVPAGTNNDLKYLEVEGTDSNTVYRSNIQPKEITLDVIVMGCDIQETSSYLERLARLLANKRDKFNNPIPNTIEFNQYPDEKWEFLCEDVLDLKAEFVEYEGTIKLVVPSGTSRLKLPTVTSSTGINQGIAKVNPTILLIATDTSITVRETKTNQEWMLNDSTLRKGDVLLLDCANRKVYKQIETTGIVSEEEDIINLGLNLTDKVDFNSDWFLLHGNYSFKCEGGMIQNISFYERR